MDLGIGGDPTLGGWLATLAYLGAGTALLWRGRPEAFWRASASLLLALGVNKQADVHSWVQVSVKEALIARDLYPRYRHELLLVSLGLLALFGLFALLLLVRGLRARGPDRGARVRTVLGWGLVATYAGLRFAYFQHLDELGLPVLAGQGAVILEIGGALWIAREGLRAADATERDRP